MVSKFLFAMYKKPYVFYFDSKQHFDNNELQKNLRREGISYDYNFSGSSKSIGMIKKINKFFENVFRKKINTKNWDVKFLAFVIKINGKIIKHLKYSSKRILFGFYKRRQLSQLHSKRFLVGTFRLGLLNYQTLLRMFRISAYISNTEPKSMCHGLNSAF